MLFISLQCAAAEMMTVPGDLTCLLLFLRQKKLTTESAKLVKIKTDEKKDDRKTG